MQMGAQTAATCLRALDAPAPALHRPPVLLCEGGARLPTRRLCRLTPLSSMDSNDTLGALPPSLGSQHKGFQSVSFGAVPVSVVPGNHDANPNGTSSNFETQIEQFRSTYGADYSSFTTRFATVVMVDSEALIWEEQGGAREPPNAQMRNESETQWTWID